MNKIQKLVKGLSLLLKEPYQINKIISDNDAWKRLVYKHYPHLVNGLPVVDLPEVIGTKELEIECYSFLNGGSLITDIALLKGLAGCIENCRYFEIGTWRGESVVNVSEKAVYCTTLNLSNEDMRKIHGDERIINQTGMFITNQTNIQRIEGNTYTFDFKSLQQTYDLIFIDGDHHYDAVLNDTQKIFQSLVHSETIVVWHDYAYSPDVLRFEVMKAIFDALPEKMHPFLYHVRNTNCCIYHPYLKATTKKLQYPDFPYYNFKVKVNLTQNNS